MSHANQPCPATSPKATVPCRRPLIAICPRTEERAKDNGEASLVQTMLFQGVLKAGGLPVMLCETTDPNNLQRYVEAFDGFIVPGGADVDPSFYGHERLEACGSVEGNRDAFECALIPRVIEADKPLFGICRGNQVVNVALGGTLWQDLPSQLGSAPTPQHENAEQTARLAAELAATGHIAHDQGRPFDALTHEVAVKEGTLLARIIGGEAVSGQAAGKTSSAGAVDLAHLMVNSLHHQAVRDVAPGLVVNAKAPDGTIEGVELPGRRFVLAVQWHPEILWPHDAPSMRLFEAFVEACR